MPVSEESTFLKFRKGHTLAYFALVCFRERENVPFFLENPVQGRNGVTLPRTLKEVDCFEAGLVLPVFESLTTFVRTKAFGDSPGGVRRGDWPRLQVENNLLDLLCFYIKIFILILQCYPSAPKPRFCVSITDILLSLPNTAWTSRNLAGWA